MTTSIWTSPASGALLNSGQPWKRGDVADIPLTFSTPPDTLTMMGGSLPPGLFFNQINRHIQGTVAALPKDQTSYPVLFRATKIVDGEAEIHDRSFVLAVNPIDEQQKFTGDAAPPTSETAWLNGLFAAGGNQIDQGNRVHFLGSIARGAQINIPLQIDNPDNDLLTYKVIGYVSGNHTDPMGLPKGLEIDAFGRITGNALITGNVIGNYYFRIYVRAPNRSEGQPKTSMKVFKLTLTSDITSDSRYSDVVRWDTPAGNIGSTYETYPSHFAVHASPQYVIQNTQGQETQSIRYTMTNDTGLLPDGLVLNADTGLITGQCPYVNGNTTYTFTVQAQVIFINNTTGDIRTSNITSKRTFSITLMSIFLTNSVMTLQFSVPPLERLEIADWVQGTLPELRETDLPSTSVPHMLTVLSRDKLFRPLDGNFGKVQNLRITIIKGLRFETGQAFITHMKDYHHPTTLRIGELKSAIAYDPQGQYIYDVLYFQMIDPQQGAGGFDSQLHEESLPFHSTQAIPSWNMPANSTNHFPNSINNIRQDLMLTANRLANPQNGETASTRGIGVDGREGLSLWMMTEQTPGNPQTIPGYQCVIELAYLQPGYGASVLKSLKQAGFEDALTGSEITLDRYLLTSDGIRNTVFDATDTSQTTWDGPFNTELATPLFLTFDVALTPVSKYYKFPPGDTGVPR